MRLRGNNTYRYCFSTRIQRFGQRGRVRTVHRFGVSSGVGASFANVKSRRATAKATTTTRVGRRFAGTVSHVSSDSQLEVIGDGVMRVDGIVARTGNRAEERTRDDYFVYETGVVVITDNFSCLKILPPGAVPALLEYCVSWLRAGGGLAGGMDPTGTNITYEREQWEDAFETFEELKMQWITDRAKVMEVIKLCANLDPQSASRKLLEIVDGALEWLKSVSTAADGGGYSGDEGKACILEGVASFTECVMLVLPIEEQQASSAAIEIESLVMKALVLTDQSSQSGGIRLGPQSLAQYAKMLECFGRIGLVRPNLPPLLVKNLFDLLGTLSAEDVSRLRFEVNLV